MTDSDSPQHCTDANLEAIFDEALREAVSKEPLPEMSVCFYPYAGLSSTIRLRDGCIYARVSDLLRPSPREVLLALARILIAKLYRRKPPTEAGRIYREYASRPEVMEVSNATRRRRGYKITSPPRGRAYDLDKVFDHLNARYFEGRLEKPVLSWSQRATRRVFGHHDGVHEAIIISRTLDTYRIPRFVLEFVLYHEMLHIKHPPQRTGSRSVYHSPEFQADERRFEKFREATDWLERIAAPARRKKRHRRKKM
ncbi:MAG: M48 family peptidase [Acidobacteriota bacterium]